MQCQAAIVWPSLLLPLLLSLLLLFAFFAVVVTFGIRSLFNLSAKGAGAWPGLEGRGVALRVNINLAGQSEGLLMVTRNAGNNWNCKGEREGELKQKLVAKAEPEIETVKPC